MEVYNKRIGILTILIIFSLNFYNQNYSNNIFLWKLMSVLPLVFLCYVKSNNFRKLRYSVLLAIALSYLLTSYFRAPIYLLTFFYYITKTAVEGKHQLVAKRNAMIVLMISFSLSFLWYFPQLNYLVRSFYYRFTTPVDEFILGEISGLKYHLYHINTLLPFFLGMFFPIFALILIWKLFTHKKKVERIMLMTVIISFIVFNVFPPKGDYFTPLFFISSIFLSDMIINSNRKIIKVISLIVIIILFLNSIVLRFEKFNDPGDLRVNLIGNNPKKVIEFINSDFRNTDKNLTLFIVNEHWSYSLSEFKYRLFINQDKHTLYYNYHLEPGYYENVTLQNRTIKGYSHETVNDSFSLIKDGVTDYVILSFLFDDRVYKNEAQKILSISDDILNSNLLLKYHLVKIINQDCMSFKKEYCQGYYIFKYNN